MRFAPFSVAEHGQHDADLARSGPRRLAPDLRAGGACVRAAAARGMGDELGGDSVARRRPAVVGGGEPRPPLGGIKCATLARTGDGGTPTPNSLSVEMADGIHGAKLTIIPHCGHLPQVEQKQATADALVEGLRI